MQIYPASSQKATTNLSPRRRHWAEKLIDWLNWHGRKAFIDRAQASIIAHDLRCDRSEVWTAVHDLWSSGVALCRQNGATTIVELLADELPEVVPSFPTAQAAHDHPNGNGNARRVRYPGRVNHG